MEPKTEAGPEKETVVAKKEQAISEPKSDLKSEKSNDNEKSTLVVSESVSETTLQKLTPALIVSVSILLASGILSATSYAKSRDMTPQVRNFYYQLPPPGPYMSNLAMPQYPREMRGNHNRSNQNSFGQKNNTQIEDQKSTEKNQQPVMVPPPWVNQHQPRQMSRPNWARPTPPWFRNQNGSAQQNNTLTEDQKSAMRNQPPAMVPPPWVNQPSQRRMNRPNWLRPIPPWFQNGNQNMPVKQNKTLTEDQKSVMQNRNRAMVPPPWVNRPNWARPTPPWIQGEIQNLPQQEPVKK